MRFSCERDDLYKAVQAVLGVVASKGVHAVYESVQITGDSDALMLQATDLEIGMKVGVGPSESLSIDRPGTAVIPAHRLASILREFPTGKVTFDWDPERLECKLQAGNARFKIQGPSPEDFPEIPDVGGAEEVAVSAASLRRMIKRTAFAAAKERMRFALNGLLLQVKDDQIELVATDGRRLALESDTCSNPGGTELRAIVPTKGFQQLDKGLAGADETVWLSVGNNHFRARTGAVTMVSRLVEGSFPSYQDVVPANCTHSAAIARSILYSALRRVSLVTSRDAQCVRLAFAAGALTVSARSSEGSAEEELPCGYDGTEEVLGFNPEFLLDALSVLEGDDISFEWNGAGSPGKITEGSYTYVVMPVSLE
jgi:DNA polymerase-3 subunit beta